ncbi:MAG: hypothetical protein Q9225_005807 [Loekoesia sp. 1 TL-2023]
MTSESADVGAASPLIPLQKSAMQRPELPKARSRRRSSQNKTSYQLAHPPPSIKNRQRLRIRPRTLLQLQQLLDTSRPLPVIDVLPSILFAPRLARKIPQIFQGKQGLGLDDLVFVRSQTQDPAIAAQDRLSEGIDETGSSDREVIAAICQSHPTVGNGQYRTEIRLGGDSTWTATALRSGAYEFVSYAHGQARSIARWVPKRDALTKDSMSAQRFKFSLINTSVRRHPVIANMSKRSIDIYDWYTIPSSPQDASRIADTESENSVALEDSPRIRVDQSDELSKTTIETDDNLRTIIAVTGIWVAFCEGWSPNFKYSTRQVISNGISELANRRKSNTIRPPSLTLERPHRQQQLKSTKEVRYRPGILHTSSLSSVPSVSSPGSPMISPRRTVSSSVTGIGDHRSRIGTYFDNNRRPSLIVSDVASDGECGDATSSPMTETCIEPKAGLQYGIIESRKTLRQRDKVSPMESFTRKESGQDLASEATLVEEVVKRPSRLRKVLGYLKRPKVTHRSP